MSACTSVGFQGIYTFTGEVPLLTLRQCVPGTKRIACVAAPTRLHHHTSSARGTGELVHGIPQPPNTMLQKEQATRSGPQDCTQRVPKHGHLFMTHIRVVQPAQHSAGSYAFEFFGQLIQVPKLHSKT